MKTPMPSSTVAKRPDAVSLLVVLGHLLLVLAPVYLAAVFSPGWWLVLPWLAFGFLMNGLLNLMHEAAHYHVFRHRAANDVLGRWILGPLAAAEFDSYRQRHWDHHRHLGEPEDPKVTYRHDIRGRRMFFHVLGCLFLVEAARKFHHQRRDHDEPAPGSSLGWLLRTVLVQGLFAASLLGVAWLSHRGEIAPALRGAATAYFLIYIYGLGSLTVLAANIRALAEHQIEGPADAHTGAAALRNFSCNVFTRLCFGAYGFGEHATHHHRPAIPYYRLPEATRILAEQESSMAPTHGYVSTVCALMRQTSTSPSINPPGPVSQ